jgi:ribosomal protein L11 methyltransferase
MPHSVLWQITVPVSTEAEDAVAAALERLLDQPAVIYTDAKTGVSAVSVYLTRGIRDIPDLHRSLGQELRAIHCADLNAEPGRISIRKVRKTDWADAWKKHFKPLAIGSTLLLKPSWSRRQPRKGQAEVVLDPGMSFGTGRHPTTWFCLSQIVRLRTPTREQSLLDIGTGSGVLAIAAAKLGYSPVHAFDADPASVRVARANAHRNDVAIAVTFAQMDIGQLPLRARKKYDVICANLTADVLLLRARQICGQLCSAGKLVLAGILASEIDQIRDAYEALQFRIVASRRNGDWHSATLTAYQK